MIAPLTPTGLLVYAPPPRTREQAIFDRLVRTLRDHAFCHQRDDTAHRDPNRASVSHEHTHHRPATYAPRTPLTGR